VGRRLTYGENSLTSTVVSGESAWLTWVAAIGVVLIAMLGFWLWRKGRVFTSGDVFRASRLSGGNRLFPTQVLITPTAVVHYTPQWIGRQEKTIHMAHVSSVNIDTGMLFSDILIETSGGSQPIGCHGHRKGDAVRIKELIEKYQTDYYRAPDRASAPNARTVKEPGSEH
jgi:hypothetical protein